MELDEGKAQTNFRLLLQQELVRRCRNNPKYSLRSFAKSLGFSSSALSAIINGKRPLTQKTKIKLGTALGLSLEKINDFKSSGRERKGKTHGENVQRLTLDTFAFISDWYHMAILELIRVHSFQPSSEWVAKALGISRSEVNFAIERLQRLNLMKIDENGRWHDLSENGNLTNINENLTSAAAKLLQKTLLEKAMAAMYEVPLELRSQTAMTFAISPEDLPVAKAKITRFRRDLVSSLQKKDPPKEVYQLTISLFPLTQITQESL